MERPMTDELILGKAQLLHDHGINIFASTVFGSPGETDKQMMKTLDMARNCKPWQCSGNVFYPLPKTKLYDMSVEMGYLDEDSQEKVRQGVSSFHSRSILQHPHKELAETLAQVTPIYAKAPRWALPALRGMVRRRMARAAKVLYLALIPITFPHVGRDGIKITVSMATKALRVRARTRARRRDGWRGIPATPPVPRTEPPIPLREKAKRDRIPVALVSDA
jgi:radical SAM superfamily enzyme YgiQ (UPF0313 family)